MVDGVVHFPSAPPNPLFHAICPTLCPQELTYVNINSSSLPLGFSGFSQWEGHWKLKGRKRVKSK